MQSSNSTLQTLTSLGALISQSSAFVRGFCNRTVLSDADGPSTGWKFSLWNLWIEKNTTLVLNRSQNKFPFLEIQLIAVTSTKYWWNILLIWHNCGIIKIYLRRFSQIASLTFSWTCFLKWWFIAVFQNSLRMLTHGYWEPMIFLKITSTLQHNKSNDTTVI